MATVYLALQESLKREVVIKVMNTSQAENTDFLDRFVNEGRIVAALRHPNIITIYDIGRVDELAYIAMEYINGGDLKSQLGKSTTTDRVFEVLIDVGSALSFAHDQGIIHRDVKPANILFRSDGTVLLSDFGIAKQIQADSELTSTGTILGSPFYMSPEQAEGMVVDGRTDIYSLGVIMYELLTGNRPYQGDSAIKVIMQHIQSPLPTLPPEFSQFQPLLNRLMAKERDARVPNAALMVDELKAFRAQITGAVTGRTMTFEQSRERDNTGTGTYSGQQPKKGFITKRAMGLLAVLIVVLSGLFSIFLYAESLRESNVAAARSQAAAAHAAANPAPRPVASPPQLGSGISEREVSKALEWLAQNSLQADRLTHPPADNAYYYYSRLIALEPGNEAAKKGLLRIAERFVVLAEGEFSRRNYGKAQSYIALGLQVDPINQGLTSLQRFIENRKDSIFDTIASFFRSE